MAERDPGSAPMRRRPPLDAVRIIAVTQFGAGPFVTQMRDPHAGASAQARRAHGRDPGGRAAVQPEHHGAAPGGWSHRMSEAARVGTPVETPDVEEIERTDVAIAPPWMTVLHNCDCHTFEEVVKQLMKAIGCSEDKGWELAWQVHNTGRAVVKVGPETECVRVGNILAAIGLVVTVTQS
jgi:ATP-dependent Clp protease adapter protein ClpS